MDEPGVVEIDVSQAAVPPIVISFRRGMKALACYESADDVVIFQPILGAIAEKLGDECKHHELMPYVGN